MPSLKQSFSILGSFLILFFLWWVFTSLLPVAVVEAKFQVKRGIDTIAPRGLKSLFVPDFDAFNFARNSDHPEGAIVIPELYLDEPIVFNVDPTDPAQYRPALRKGIAHASSTALPGEGGLGYYFAHSSSPELRSQFNAVFYLLGKLETGDEMYIWEQGEVTEYEVVGELLTEPQETDFLYDYQYPAETIVLQTCWPPGTTQKRLLIFAQLKG